MIDTRLQGMWKALKQYRAAEEGSSVQAMMIERVIPKMAAAHETHPKVRVYLYREIARAQTPNKTAAT
jgi:hypothetical protein